LELGRGVKAYLLLSEHSRGKTAEQKKKWIEEIARFSMDVTSIRAAPAFTVIIEEIAKENRQR
jgi:phenylpyruvate tautomerase PptA (4-oxalocrotonate tautomerase family)